MKALKIYEPETVFDFGKNKGRTLEDVASTDVKYIVWCLLNVDHFFVDKELVLEYQKKYEMKLIDVDKSGNQNHIATLNSFELSNEQLSQLEFKWSLIKSKRN